MVAGIWPLERIQRPQRRKAEIQAVERARENDSTSDAHIGAKSPARRRRYETRPVTMAPPSERAKRHLPKVGVKAPAHLWGIIPQNLCLRQS